MKGKMIEAIVVIAAIAVVSVTQSIRTSDLESTAPVTTYVEAPSTTQPSATRQALHTLEPTVTPEATDIPEPTIMPEVTVTPEPTVIPEPTSSPEAVIKEGIVTSASSVNIRQKASTDSAIVGKLYTGAVLTIENEQNGWYSISSGNVKGYVSSDLITVSDNIDALKKKYQYSYAVVGVKLLNARSQASTDASVVTKLEANSQHKVLSVKGDWVQIALYNTEMVGYVSKEYVSIKSKELTAVSIEEDKQTKQSIQVKLTQLQQEQVETQNPTSTIAPTVTPSPTRTPTPTKTPTATKTPTPTKTPSATKTPTPTNATVPSVGSSLTNSKEDQLKLLSCIIYCESGYETYEGKLAVANVILNRVKSSSYPNTIKGVVYQKSQFSPASSGRLETQLKKYSSYSTKSQLECIQAAKEALAGSNNVGKRTNFRSSMSVSIDEKPNAIQIGAHVFW